MKITINPPEPKKIEEKPFPKLMISKYSEQIILATERNGTELSGTIIRNPINQNGFVGQSHICFIASNFVDFEGSITLRND